MLETTSKATLSVQGIDPENVPSHIAVIMDGNGRWAKKQGMAKRLFGHNNAIEAVRACVEGSAELGVKYLTLYAFSTENWGRPKEEVEGLMTLLVHTIAQETKTLNKNQIRLSTIGHTEGLPKGCQKELATAMAETAHNTRMTLVLALNYSGRWDITQAMQRAASDAQAGRLDTAAITAQTVEAYLATAGMPDPELLIRTSGEQRISNFLLWQMAYTELHITDVLWPDFRKEHLHLAIQDYQQRHRRFGLV